MRVFILCTGRSGSTSIIKACKHIENYSSGHETLSRKFGEDRFNYPENHIEADNRLAWHLGKLNKLYGNRPIYVHLRRNRDKTAQSFFSRFYLFGSIIDSFCEGIRMTPSEKLSKETRLQACYDYIDTVNSNIEYFLSDKSKVFYMNLETIKEDFRKFWKEINAIGDIESALQELNITYNSTKRRKLNYRYRLKLILIREFRHLLMCLKL